MFPIPARLDCAPSGIPMRGLTGRGACMCAVKFGRTAWLGCGVMSDTRSTTDADQIMNTVVRAADCPVCNEPSDRVRVKETPRVCEVSLCRYGGCGMGSPVSIAAYPVDTAGESRCNSPFHGLSAVARSGFSSAAGK